MNRRDDDIPDDEALVARIAAGDCCALEMLYARHWGSVRRYCRLFDERLVDELSQDALLAVWQSAGRYVGRASVRTWLLIIARNQAHNTLRRRELPIADDPLSETIPAIGLGPEDEVIALAGCEEIAQAIRSLSAIHREILGLAFDQELSYSEMAEVLGVPIGTIKSRLNLAKKALAAVLDGRETSS